VPSGREVHDAHRTAPAEPAERIDGACPWQTIAAVVVIIVAYDASAAARGTVQPGSRR